MLLPCWVSKWEKDVWDDVTADPSLTLSGVSEDKSKQVLIIYLAAG